MSSNKSPQNEVFKWAAGIVITLGLAFGGWVYTNSQTTRDRMWRQLDGMTSEISANTATIKEIIAARQGMQGIVEAVTKNSTLMEQLVKQGQINGSMLSEAREKLTAMESEIARNKASIDFMAPLIMEGQKKMNKASADVAWLMRNFPCSCPGESTRQE